MKYSEKIIAFALTERSRGVRWNDIQNSIRQAFQIQPPSERRMRSWYKEHGGGSIDLEKALREASIKVGRDSMVVAGLATQQLALQQGIPTLLKALRQNKDPRIASVIMILSTLEHMVGSEVYEKGIRKYQQKRRRRAQNTKITGWLSKSSPDFESGTGSRPVRPTLI